MIIEVIIPVIRCYVDFGNGTPCMFDFVLKKRDVIISNIELSCMSFPRKQVFFHDQFDCAFVWIKSYRKLDSNINNTNKCYFGP